MIVDVHVKRGLRFMKLYICGELGLGLRVFKSRRVARNLGEGRKQVTGLRHQWEADDCIDSFMVNYGDREVQRIQDSSRIHLAIPGTAEVVNTFTLGHVYLLGLTGRGGTM